MELHVRNKILSDGWKYIAWCDEGILLTSSEPKHADILIDNRKAYFGVAEVTEDDGLVFSCCKIVEE